MAINTMLLNEQKSLRRLEYSISQNIVQSAIQGLVSQDAQSIHKGISKMFDNFSIMTRAVEGSEEQTRLNNDYAVELTDLLGAPRKAGELRKTRGR